MSDSEYQALLAKVPSFLALDEEGKAEVAAAKGEERAGYVRIFQDELAMLAKASEETVTQNDEAIGHYKFEVKKDAAAERQKAESQTAQEDLDKAEGLLKEI